MKKGIIILFIALLGISFPATSALAGSSHGHGYNGTSITVAGCGATGYFQVHSGFTGPPMFFPFPPPFFHGTVVKSRCNCCKKHHRRYNAYYHKSYRHGHPRAFHKKCHRQKHYRRHKNDRHRNDHGKGKKHRSDGHRKRI